jgi:hypothetical protein
MSWKHDGINITINFDFTIILTDFQLQLIILIYITSTVNFIDHILYQLK